MKLTKKQIKHTIKVKNAARALLDSLESMSPWLKAIYTTDPETRIVNSENLDNVIAFSKKVESGCIACLKEQERYK